MAGVVIYDHGQVYIAHEILIYDNGHVYQVTEIEPPKEEKEEG